MFIWLSIEIIVFIIIILAGLFLIKGIEAESKAGCMETTGAMHSFDISHKEPNFYHPTKRVSGRDDDKYFNYLEGMHKSRDKTFMKGRVFLREK